MMPPLHVWGALALAWLALAPWRPAAVAAAPQALQPDIRVRHVLDTAGPSASVRLAKDPRDDGLYLLKVGGEISRVSVAAGTVTLLYTAADHGVASAQGMAFGPDGTLYLVGNEDRPGTQTRATIMKGTPQAGGPRRWTVLAQTADYPRSNTAFDHRFNGAVVRPAGDVLYVSSGSRTDHGEVQSAGGLYPGLREAGLTVCVLRLPTGAEGLFLPDDRAALKGAGYVFAEGTRNAFDLAFDAGGRLFATDNGPDRDMSDELNWLRAEHDYGFPWRMGGADNPQQFPDYDPALDLLLDERFPAVQSGAYHNDPAFPPPGGSPSRSRWSTPGRTPTASATRTTGRCGTPARRG